MTFFLNWLVMLSEASNRTCVRHVAHSVRRIEIYMRIALSFSAIFVGVFYFRIYILTQLFSTQSVRPHRRT